MRKIDKGDEPASLTAFKRRTPGAKYADLGAGERQDIRQRCTEEQFHLCAYCCQEINGSHADTRNEHVEPQDLAPKRTLDFSNVVASCTTPRQCDAAHRARRLALTPLMAECETELRFRFSGLVEGSTARARETITILNLGDNPDSNKALVEKRRQLINSLLWVNFQSPPEELVLEDDPQLIKMMIDDLSIARNGKLAPFSPVLVNILRARLEQTNC
ncbi:MAG: hypothetical protein ABW202_06955 [Duganella sp.]